MQRSTASKATALHWTRPQPDVIVLDSDEEENVVEIAPPPSKRQKRSTISSPISMFATEMVKPEDNLDCVKFCDLVSDPNLVKTYQFNFQIDMEYLFDSMGRNLGRCEVCLVTSLKYLVVDAELLQQLKVSTCDVKLARYGTHHTKMMVNFFGDGTVQIIVHTANLTYAQLNYNAQMLWKSPILCKGNGSSNFKRSMLRYLKSYNLPEMDQLSGKLQGYDFSGITAELITSSPGDYTLDLEHPSEEVSGYAKLYQVLKQQNLLPSNHDTQMKILAQISTIASPYEDSRNIFLHLLAPMINGSRFPLRDPGAMSVFNSCKTDNYESIVVFPTEEEVKQSAAADYAGAAIIYQPFPRYFNKSMPEHRKALNRALHRWVSDSHESDRSLIPPHCKTYLASEDNYKTLKWMLMTSSNLSKQAWGCPDKSVTPEDLVHHLKVQSFEVGVLLCASQFEGKPLVPFYKTNCTLDDSVIPVRLPFAVPPTRYAAKDTAWGTANSLAERKQYTKK